jgi:predicted dehydrogenase
MEDVYSTPEDKSPGYGGRRGQLLVQDWLDCIRTGRRDNRATARGTLATLELIDAIFQSSREGKRVACRIEPA